MKIGDLLARYYMEYNRTSASNLSANMITIGEDFEFKIISNMINQAREMSSGFWIIRNEFTNANSDKIKIYLDENRIKYEELHEGHRNFLHVFVLNWRDPDHREIIDSYPEDRFSERNKEKRITINQQEYLDLIADSKALKGIDHQQKCQYCYNETDSISRTCDGCYQKVADCKASGGRCYTYTCSGYGKTTVELMRCEEHRVK